MFSTSSLISKGLPSMVRGGHSIVKEFFLYKGISLNGVLISKGLPFIVSEGTPSIVRGFLT
jgi:hypothetical protein